MIHEIDIEVLGRWENIVNMNTITPGQSSHLRESYIEDFFFITDAGKEKIRVFLKYDFKGNSVIESIKRVSRPGLRVYVGVDEAPRVLDGLGISILSTPKGVMSDHQAKKNNVGGEILCEVF